MIRKVNRYRNKTFTNASGKWDSVHEYKVYLKLKADEDAGKIHNLKRQVEFILIPPAFEDIVEISSTKTKIKKVSLYRKVSYYADFTYEDAKGNVVVVDAKSSITRKNPEYIIKKKLMYEKYKIKIVEIV